MSRKQSTGTPYSHISLPSIFRMAAANLRFKRFRTIITLIGIVIGVGSIYLLLSFGIGLQELVQGQIVGNQTINTVDVSSANSKIVKLDKESIEKIGDISHVTDVSSIYSLASRVSFDQSTTDAVMYGIDGLYRDLTNFSLVAGSLVNTYTTTEVLVNNSLLSLIGVDNPQRALGRTITTNVLLPSGEEFKQDFQIVGVIDSNAGAELFVSKNVFDKVDIPTYSLAKVVVDDRSNIADVRWNIESLGYETTSPIDTIDQINNVFRFFNLVLVSLGSIGMVIAALGMVNTLTVSLLERTREIALMMTLGARRRDMRRLFTVEAITLSLLGGIIGVVVAIILGAIVNFILNQMAVGRGVSEPFNVFASPPLLIIGMLALMIVIGLLVSYIPARRASRINPVTALRQE